jgi:hypothetical protein
MTFKDDLTISTISNYLLKLKKGENNEYEKQMLSFGVLSRRNFN